MELDDQDIDEKLRKLKKQIEESDLTFLDLKSMPSSSVFTFHMYRITLIE